MVWGITDIGTYVLGVIAIVLLPGPNSLYVLSVVVRRGVCVAYQGVFGVLLGDALLMLLAAGGVASVLQASPGWFLALKYGGAAYLSWIGLSMMRRAWRKWRQDQQSRIVEDSDVASVDSGAPFRRALLISLMNPKAIVFFLSFFVQFVDPAYAHPAATFFLLGLIVQGVSFFYLSSLIWSGAWLAGQFRRFSRLSAGLMGSVGALFIGFGAKLATASLN